jgi:hypothetical protein
MWRRSIRIVLALGLLITLFAQSANVPGLGHLLGRYRIGQVRAANTWTVTDTSNSATDIGSLRHALASAQNGDTITFDPAVFGTPQTITLGSTLTIATNVTIAGPGQSLLTLDGADKYQVLSIPGGVTAAISGLTIARGNAVNGGGISNFGTLAVTNSTLGDNVAYGSASGGGGGFGGSIFNAGTLAVSNSTLNHNSASGTGTGIGGGIYNTGMLTINDSTVSDNIADGSALDGDGGGISNNGALTITNSTLSGNAANGSSSEGFGGFGGGIQNAGTLTIDNSTLSGDSASGYVAGGGGIYDNGALTVGNSTLSGNIVNSTGGFGGNGGGIFRPQPGAIGPLTVSNSVVSGNKPDDLPGYTAPNTDIVGLTVGGTTYTLGQILAVQADGVTPLLADNGGPTQTIALVAGSPAIGLGRDCVAADGTTPLTTDQRGYSRPNAPATCDAGAYEFSQAAPSATPTGSSTATATTTATPTGTATATATATPQPLAYQIQQGWNLFAYTDASTGITTASQLLGAILRQSGGSLAALYGLTQYRWFPSIVDAGGSLSPPDGDFALQPDTCYLLYSDQAATLSLPAAQAPPQPVAHLLQQGWNLFAYTGSASGIDTAAQLLGALLQQSGGSLAALYGLTNNSWSPSLIDSGGAFIPPNGDFPLQPDTGYLLYSDRAVRFSLQAAARYHPVIRRVQPLRSADRRQVRAQLPPLPPLPRGAGQLPRPGSVNR